MTVKEAVLAAAVELGVSEEVEAFLEGSSTEGEKKTKLLQDCYNIVENELALDYLPLQAEDELETDTGTVYFSNLEKSAVRILRVSDEWGNSVKFTLFPDFLKTQPGKIKVLYTYTPGKKTLTDDSEFALYVSERLLGYGIAAEYALAAGLYEEAAVFERKYKDAIQAAYKISHSRKIQSRRWV